MSSENEDHLDGNQYLVESTEAYGVCVGGGKAMFYCPLGPVPAQRGAPAAPLLAKCPPSSTAPD